MSLETRIPKEINDYREKLVFGLSARQLGAVGVAVAVVGATAAVMHGLLGIDLKIVEYVLILEAMPIVAVGFLRPKSLDFEDFATVWCHHRFGPKRLPNMTDVDFLTSLYPMHPENAKQGDGSHEIPRKERKRRRKALKECLQEPAEARAKHGRPKRRPERRPRPSRLKRREAARGAQAQERARTLHRP